MLQHIEAFNKLIIKQDFVHQVGKLLGPKQLSGTLNHFPQFQNTIYSRNFPQLSRQPHTLFHKTSELSTRMFNSSSFFFSFSSSSILKNTSICLQFEKCYKTKKICSFICHCAIKHLHTHPKNRYSVNGYGSLADYDPLLSPLSTTQVTCLGKPTS